MVSVTILPPGDVTEDGGPVQVCAELTGNPVLERPVTFSLSTADLTATGNYTYRLSPSLDTMSGLVQVLPLSLNLILTTARRILSSL